MSLYGKAVEVRGWWAWRALVAGTLAVTAWHLWVVADALARIAITLEKVAAYL